MARVGIGSCSILALGSEYWLSTANMDLRCPGKKNILSWVLKVIHRQMPGLCPEPQPRQAPHHHHHDHHHHHQTLFEDLQ
jgi:hypothetical protein